MTSNETRRNRRVFRQELNRYAVIGVGAGLLLVVLATLLSAWSEFGRIDIHALALAQLRIPTLWLVDLLPILVAVFGQLIGRNLTMNAGLMVEGETRKLREERSRLVAKLEDEAVTGPELGLPNRHAFENQVDKLLADFDDIDAGAIVLRLQTDSFQSLHRSSGQETAFDLVTQLARRLENAVGDGFAAYFGYDEFALYLPGNRNPADAQRIGERLALLFDAPMTLDGHAHSVRCAIGIARYPDDGESSERLLQLAEMAQYAAEQDKRDYSIYDPEHNSHAAEVSQLTAELAASIDSESMFAVYQPAFLAHSEELQRLRLCPRWPHALRGTLDEDAILRLADRTSIIHSLSLWLLREGVARLASWRSRVPGLRLQIRLPGRAYGLLPVANIAVKLLAAHDAPAEQLQLLLSESDIAEGGDPARAELDELHDAGIGLILDEFGGRGSSPAAAVSLPVSEVRLCESLLSGIDDRGRSEIVVSSMVTLAQQLSLAVTAPGIDDIEQLNFLRSLDCHFIEGDQLGVAVPVEEMTDWIGRRMNAATDTAPSSTATADSDAAAVDSADTDDAADSAEPAADGDIEPPRPA